MQSGLGFFNVKYHSCSEKPDRSFGLDKVSKQARVKHVKCGTYIGL